MSFFCLCRRGQGLSADQGPFTQDLLKQAEAKGPEARKQLHYQLITGSQLDDALAGQAFLKTVPGVDPKRIGISASYRGILRRPSWRRRHGWAFLSLRRIRRWVCFRWATPRTTDSHKNI
jgi:hypothetical protein